MRNYAVMLALLGLLGALGFLSGCSGSSSVQGTIDFEEPPALDGDLSSPITEEQAEGDSRVFPAALGVICSGDSVVDEDQATRTGKSSDWHRAIGLGYAVDMLYTSRLSGRVTSRWASGLGRARYEVLVFIPRNYAGAYAYYQVQEFLNGGWRTLQTVKTNQNSYWDNWATLGTFTFSGQPGVLLVVNPQNSSQSHPVGFDAVWFRPPLSNSIQRAKYDTVGRAEADVNWRGKPGYCLPMVTKRWSRRTRPPAAATWNNPNDVIKYFTSKGCFVTSNKNSNDNPLKAPFGAWVLWKGRNNGHIGIRCAGSRGVIHQALDKVTYTKATSFSVPESLTYAGYVKWEDVYRYTVAYTGRYP